MPWTSACCSPISDVADAVDWLTRVFGFVSMSGLATIAPSSGSVMAR